MKLITLIPAYKTKYIPDLMNGLRLQSVAPGRIVISDDSPGGEFRRVFESDAFTALREGLDVEFHEGPRNGAYENLKQLVRLGQGRAELMHFLLDDDVIYPEFYERHLQAHAAGEFSWSVSRRWWASEGGIPLKGQGVPPAVQQHPNRLLTFDDQLLAMTAVAHCSNWLGEFSNAVMRADCADILLEPRIGEVSFAGLWDIGAFVAGSMRRPLCYLQDHLGYFRTSPTQNSANLAGPLMKGAHVGHCAIALGLQRLGRMDAALARDNYRIMARTVALRYADTPDMAPFVDLLPRMAAGEEGADERFLAAWNGFLAANGL